MSSKKKDRKQEILDLILESVDNKSATTAPMKKLFTKKKLDEIVEYIYEILWDEKFNPDDKVISKKIKEYIELQIKANSK